MKHLLGLLIAGLATGAIAQDTTPGCMVQLQANERIQALIGKVPVNVSKGQPLELLASSETPSAEEKAALSVFGVEYDRCYDLGDEWRHDHFPATLVSYVTKYRVDTMLVLADLYSGKLSYGEAAKTRAKHYLEFQTNWNSVTKEVQAQRSADDRQRAAFAQQQEMARKQAALAILSKPIPPIQLQPLPQSLTPKSSTTSCGWEGSHWICRALSQ